MRARDLTLDTSSADAAYPTRAGRRPSAAVAPETAGALTRAELRRRAAEALAAEQTAVAAAPSAETASLAAALDLEDAPAVATALPLRRRTRAAGAQPDVIVAGDGEATGADVPDTFAAMPEPDSCLADEFEYAARLFSFTAETAVVRADEEEQPADAATVVESSAHVAPRRARLRRVSFRRVAAGSFSIAAMAVVGLLAIGITTPASVVAAASPASADITGAVAEQETTDIQAFVSSSKDKTADLDRPQAYDVTSMADLAADSGVTMFAGTWVNNPAGTIQWPFPVGVPVSAAYGSNTYLSQFSSPHRGVDLTPGEGADIHALAAGTVRIATEAGGDYGVTVLIDHVIDGQLVSTRYAHMLRGSLAVEQGQVVTVGQALGKVGQTGKATGPHLHLEVLLGGTVYTDPIEWLQQHTTGTHTVG